jgi:hypothetical protein
MTDHVLALADGAIVLDATYDLPLRGMAAEHGQHEAAVGDEDRLPRPHGRGEARVRARQLLAAALEVVIGREGDVLPLFQGDLLGVVGEESGAYLRSLGVEEDACFFFISVFMMCVVYSRMVAFVRKLSSARYVLIIGVSPRQE